MKTNSQTDAELILAYRSGDANALTELVKRWHFKLCQKAYWIVKDPDLSKDVAQDTWHVVIDKIGTLNNVERFGSWILRIVYTKSFDALRLQSRKLQKEKELEISNSIQVETIENDALQKVLLDAIMKLPESQQKVIRLFYNENYSLKEISKLLDISIGTTKSRLFHAREKLKKTLKNNTL